MSELAAKVPAAAVEATNRGKLLVRHDGPAADLLVLRTVDNVYAAVGAFAIGPYRADLPALERAIADANLEPALRHVAGALPVSPSFLVNASRTGSQTYTRYEAAAAATRGLLAKRRAWHEGAPNAHDLEFRLDVGGDRALFSLRLTPPTHRYRGPERAFAAAALRPTVAHALVWLSAPRADHVFVDPFCGSGTILAERAAYPAARILGGDQDPAALAAARENLAPTATATVHLHRWDAGRLPLRAGSVDALVTNLPFGRQILEATAIAPLYGAFAAEAARVLTATGSALALTDQTEALRAAAAAHALTSASLATLSLKGRHPEVIRLQPA